MPSYKHEVYLPYSSKTNCSTGKTLPACFHKPHDFFSTNKTTSNMAFTIFNSEYGLYHVFSSGKLNWGCWPEMTKKGSILEIQVILRLWLGRLQLLFGLTLVRFSRGSYLTHKVFAKVAYRFPWFSLVIPFPLELIQFLNTQGCVMEAPFHRK